MRHPNSELVASLITIAATVFGQYSSISCQESSSFVVNLVRTYASFGADLNMWLLGGENCSSNLSFQIFGHESNFGLVKVVEFELELELAKVSCFD